MGGAASVGRHQTDAIAAVARTAAAAAGCGLWRTPTGDQKWHVSRQLRVAVLVTITLANVDQFRSVYRVGQKIYLCITSSKLYTVTMCVHTIILFDDYY